MKKFMVFLTGVAFITLISVATADAQDPKKKKSECTKAKTECCSKTKAKKSNCATTCDKKETKKATTAKTEKKEEKKKKN